MIHSIVSLAVLSLATADSTLRIATNADNKFKLEITNSQGVTQQLSELDDWHQFSTVETVLKSGNGPWTLHAAIEDYGVIAGFSSSVWLDERIISKTSVNPESSRWKFFDGGANSLAPPMSVKNGQYVSWTSPAYSSETSGVQWVSIGSSQDCVEDLNKVWSSHPGFIQEYRKTFERGTTPVWPGSCKNINTRVFARLVIHESDLEGHSVLPNVAPAFPGIPLQYAETKVMPTIQYSEPQPAPAIMIVEIGEGSSSDEERGPRYGRFRGGKPNHRQAFVVGLIWFLVMAVALYRAYKNEQRLRRLDRNIAEIHAALANPVSTPALVGEKAPLLKA